MALIQTQDISTGGLSPSLQAASGSGDSFQPGATTFLFIKNGDASQHTVTVATTATAYGQPISNVAIPVPAGSEVMAGPFEPGMVAQPATGLASLTYDAVTSVSIAAINL